jgi:hypothetical protein
LRRLATFYTLHLLKADLKQGEKTAVNPRKVIAKERPDSDMVEAHSSGFGSSFDEKSPDRKDRAFIYPCRAFKQFLITLKEGKIDLNDIEKSPLFQ